MSGEIESREIVLVHAVDVRTVQRHLELRQQITILVVLAEQTLHARVDEDLAIIQFLRGTDIRRIWHVERRHFRIRAGILVDQILAIPRICRIGRQFGRNAVDHRPVKIRTRQRSAEIVIEHIHVILAVRQRIIGDIRDGMLAAGIRKITGLRQETAGLIGAGPHGWLADHIIKRRIRFQIIHLDDGGRLTGGEQCGTVIQQLNGIAVQPIPTILGIRIRLVGSRMRGGGLIVGEQLTEIHQAGYTSGGSAELDDLILHGVVVTAELGGQQHDVAVGIHRIIMMQNVVGSQIFSSLPRRFIATI